MMAFKTQPKKSHSIVPNKAKDGGDLDHKSGKDDANDQTPVSEDFHPITQAHHRQNDLETQSLNLSAFLRAPIPWRNSLVNQSNRTSVPEAHHCIPAAGHQQ